MKEMFVGQHNSLETFLTEGIQTSNTSITVEDGSLLPEAPNILILGDGEVVEIIKYETKEGNVVSDITRGFDSIAMEWAEGTKVMRGFTCYDHNTLVDNMNTLIRKANAVVGGGAAVPLGLPTHFVALEKGDIVELYWGDPKIREIKDGLGNVVSEWEGTMVRKKEGSLPENETDGELVIDSSSYNAHTVQSENPVIVENESNVFYRIFVYNHMNFFIFGHGTNIVHTQWPHLRSAGAAGSRYAADRARCDPLCGQCLRIAERAFAEYGGH